MSKLYLSERNEENEIKIVVPGTGIEPVRPLCRKAADFKSAVSTNFTTRAVRRSPIVSNFEISFEEPAHSAQCVGQHL
jgi:hypothetical protein